MNEMSKLWKDQTPSPAPLRPHSISQIILHVISVVNKVKQPHDTDPGGLIARSLKTLSAASLKVMHGVSRGKSRVLPRCRAGRKTEVEAQACCSQSGPSGFKRCRVTGCNRRNAGCSCPPVKREPGPLKSTSTPQRGSQPFI